MGWFKDRKEKAEERDAKKRQFLTTLKYGANLDEQWQEHKRLENERRELWKEIEGSKLYKEYDRTKKEERRVELSVLDAIRKEHELPITERRWNDGTLIVWDSFCAKTCEESPIGYCTTYTPNGGSITSDKPCLFCGRDI